MLGTTTKAEATWTCETCGVIEPFYNEYGKSWRKQRCACQIAKEEQEYKARERAQFLAGLETEMFAWLGSTWSDRDLKAKTFESFQSGYQDQGKQLAEAFAKKLGARTLVLYGSFGTGKTHLLAAICNYQREQGKKCRFTTAPNLFAAINSRIGHNDNYTQLLSTAGETPLLVIDDVDKARWSEFREEVYFLIMDMRARRGLPTAISTNRLETLSDFVGGAVASRLSIGQIPIEMAGKDFRKS